MEKKISKERKIAKPRTHTITTPKKGKETHTLEARVGEEKKAQRVANQEKCCKDGGDSDRNAPSWGGTQEIVTAEGERRKKREEENPAGNC